MYSNVQGLINNYTQVEIIAAMEKPDFLILSETHLTKEVEDKEIDLHGYYNIASLSTSTRTGGVIIYCKKHWNMTKIFEKVDDMKYWILVCRAVYNNYNILVCAIYRSPSHSEAEFCDTFDEIVEEICDNNCDILITGDFNIDWLKSSVYKNRIRSILNDNGLRQIVNECTRVTKNSSTIIDYVITNNCNITSINSRNGKISDHAVINISIARMNIQNLEETKSVEIFKYNKSMFNTALLNVMKYEDCKDLNQNVEFFDSCLLNTIQRFTYKKEMHIGTKLNRWYSRDLQTMKREKIIKYLQAKIENTNRAWTEYKKIRNHYKVQIENNKNNYITNKINNASDQKQMWKQIKTLVLKKSQNMTKSVIFDQREYNNSCDIVNKFNTFFVDSVNKIRQSIDEVQYSNQITYNIHQIFKFRKINLLELESIIKQMKNKSDNEGVSNKIVLDNWNVIGKVLLRIINMSLETGIFPENWKISTITPIEKVPRTRKCEEFRPINTLKTCEKIIEKVVKVQLEKYIETNNILSKHQSGFRKKHSCETTVNYVLSELKTIGKNKKSIAIFLDFKRAFETIDRNIMMAKLFMYGIRGTELEWFKSYMDNRRQITKLNGAVSVEAMNDFGVPQSSILGALLFIIYINDMPNIFEKCKVVLYADDTLIYTVADNDEECRENISSDIEKIDRWLKMNKLKLNENKTKIMEINIDSDEIFKINETIIEKVDHIKYLGFIIDRKLNFTDHIEYTCKKIGKKIGFLKRIRSKISRSTAVNIYNTIIKPHFEYGSTILYTCSNTSGKDAKFSK